MTISSEELAHFGVKGMKWGVRKESTSSSIHPDYTSSRRTQDRKMFGEKGVNRVNERLHSGASYHDAHKKEVHRSNFTSAVKVGAIVATVILTTHGDTIVKNLGDSISTRAAANRGKRAMADAHGLNVPNVNLPAEQDPNGVYKVTDL